MSQIALDIGLPENRLGVVCWWSARNVEVTIDELKNSFDFLAPPFTELIPQELCSPHTALRRARNRSRSQLDSNLDWEDIGVAGSQLTIALVYRDTDKKLQTFESHSKWVVTCCDNTAAVEVMRDKVKIDLNDLPANERNALQRLFEAYNRERQSLTYQDLHRIIHKSFAMMNCIRIKQGGSVYFIPKGSDELFDYLRDAIECSGVRLSRVPVIDSESSRIDIAHPAKEAILEEAMDLAKKIEDWSEKSKTEKVRKSSAEARLVEIAELKEKANLYKTILSIGLDDVEKAIKNSEELLESAIEELARKR